MKKKQVLYIVFAFILAILIAPKNVEAKENNKYRQENIIEQVECYQSQEFHNIFLAYNKPVLNILDCSNSWLGNPADPNSVAWLLQKLLNYIRALGPMIVIIMSGIEFAKFVFTSDDDGMAKAQKKLIYRLLLIVLLFFIPNIVMALLDIFGLTSSGTCGIE